MEKESQTETGKPKRPRAAVAPSSKHSDLEMAMSFREKRATVYTPRTRAEAERFCRRGKAGHSTESIK